MAQGKELAVTQTVPLTVEDRRTLRLVAVAQGTTPGLLARALILDGLGRVDSPEVKTRIAEEQSALDTRRSLAGKAAMAARWGRNDDDASGEDR